MILFLDMLYVVIYGSDEFRGCMYGWETVSLDLFTVLGQVYSEFRECTCIW
jgi:hypothetical protein